ncbi:sugar transporter [Trematosphaeria pertusa]|uniref:Sugar transporter n=1 Tax=Trematosphaeria pertusa TaxID=390896 RepID=A0A6A6I6N6_9PLEO|nr:sugar transporter [Trematosphaeria pertusa]KAF2245889.1 sugar transporter [Trematosphaeria pertusa]
MTEATSDLPKEDLKKELSPSVDVGFASTEEAEKSLQFTEVEHAMGFWQAAKLYWPAICWGLFINLATILKGMDGGIVGSLIGLEPFKRDYGYEFNGTYIVAAHWVSAFNYANKLGAICGALASGFAYDKLGPRCMMAACSGMSVAFIFLQFFAHTPGQLFAGELINGCIIAFYPICASAYIGEVCPLALRGFAASMTNLAFVIGQFIASGILKGTNGIDSKYSYKVPIATQWALPAVMLSIIYFCPDPPYWLCKKGRYEAAEKSLRRLATSDVEPSLKLAHIKETLRLETTYNDKDKPTILDCFRGANFRRLIICVMAYDMQAFTGNILFIDYAVYFFELAGLDASNAFSMNLGLTAIGFVGTCLSWPLASYIGRRTAYFWGCTGLAVLLFLIGAIDLAPRSSHAPTWAQCSLMLICNLIYDITIGPFCFILLAEVSSAKLRGMTIALATVTCHIVSIVFSVVIPYALNEDQGNWRGKLGFLFAGLSFLCAVYCFFCLPETKDRTFEELDIMFERRIGSRKFKDYEINGAVEAREELGERV